MKPPMVATATMVAMKAKFTRSAAPSVVSCIFVFPLCS
jgi:hypothetical protein